MNEDIKYTTVNYAEIFNRAINCISEQIIDVESQISLINNDQILINEMILQVKRRKPKNWNTAIVEYKKNLKDIGEKKNTLIAEKLQMRKNKLVLERLSVINRYIDEIIKKEQYPIRYQLRCIKDYDCDFCNIIEVGLINSPGSHYIGITVENLLTIDENIKWSAFAEMMISTKRDGEEYFYKRSDFGLSKDVDDNDYNIDFRIYNLKELHVILQKFDSWYGSGLD